MVVFVTQVIVEVVVVAAEAVATVTEVVVASSMVKMRVWPTSPFFKIKKLHP